MKVNQTDDYVRCKICKKEIDDHGILFCSKCRKKDWKKRFLVIREINMKIWNGKYGRKVYDG